MAVGRISGPLLKANLLRNGVDLAFETDLLFLKVNSPTNSNPRVGINTNNPQYDLDVAGVTRTTDLEVINQAKIGSLIFDGNNLSSTTNTLSFLPANNDFTVYQSKIQIDDLVIQNNQISTAVSNSNLQFRPNGTGKVEIFSDANVYGNLYTSGNITADGDINIGGNITIGNESTDTISIVAGITSNLRPETTDTYTLGTDSLRWKDLYANRLVLSDIEIFDNVIRTITSNANLELKANGTGAIRLEKIDINENVISTWDSNQDLILRPNGSGVIRFDTTQAITLPRGTTAERPLSATAGMLRYNTETSKYEGYDGSAWYSLAGVEDADGNTKITAELTPGANDNTIRFYSNGNIVADMNATRFNINNSLTVGNISIQSNLITTTVSNENFTIEANGTGSVRLANFAFNNNTITNTVTDAVSLLQPTGNGYFKFQGTNGFVLPVGSSLERPTAYAVVGMTRFNTDNQVVEIWNGSTWQNPSGAQGAITEAVAIDVAIEKVIQLG
jgi:hypothetical protein